MKRKREYTGDGPPKKRRKLEMHDPELQELRCPMSKQLFNDPVAAADGRTYERDWVARWFKNNRTSPHSGERISTTLYPNLPMKNIVDSVIEKHPECKEYQYTPDMTYINNRKTVMRYVVQKRYDMLIKYKGYFIMDVINENMFHSNMTILEHVTRNCTNDDVVIYLLDNCQDIDVPDDVSEYRPIHILCEHGSPRVIQHILGKNVELESKTNFGCTPLYFICKHQEPEMVKEFCDRGANIEYLDNIERTALHIACKYNEPEAIKILIEHGGDVTKKDKNGNYPHDICLRFQNMKTIMYVAHIFYKTMLDSQSETKTDEADETDDEIDLLFENEENTDISFKTRTRYVSSNDNIGDDNKYGIILLTMMLDSKLKNKTLKKKDIEELGKYNSNIVFSISFGGTITGSLS